MKVRILHLEDNRDDVELVRKTLARQGLDCEIRDVANEAEYLRELEAGGFDLILSDSGLPGYDGREALVVARLRYPSIPFIVLSGHPRKDEDGAAASIAKDNLRALAPAIVEALRKAAEPDPACSPTYVRGMRHLVTVVQRLSLARSLEGVMAIVRRAARELTGADGATFVLRDGERCFYADEDAIGPLWKGQRFPLSACISGWAMLNRQPAVIPDIYVDPRIPHDAYRPTFVRSLVMMPIRTVDPIGAIGVYWASPHEAAREEVSLLQALADSASIAMEAVDLFANLENRVAERTAELHRRSQELELLNKELEAFSYSVAHDLRSPLRAIDGFAHELLEASEPLGAEARENIDCIRAAAKRMHGLIDDLLGLSRIVRTPMRVTTVDLSLLARDIVRGLHESAPQRRGEFVISDGLHAEGDPGLLRIALENLLSNAWKFSSRREHARVELGTCPGSGACPIFFVRDNGSGFEPRFADKLFAPFQRLHEQADFPGTGVGLAIVQRVIHRHGGRIWAESDGRSGATFFFSIPNP